MRVRIGIILLLTLVATLSAYAQREVEVTGYAEYMVPSNISMDQARKIVLERAKLQALADEFGTTISQSNTMYSDSEADVDKFSSLSESVVKGEWIKTIGKPEYVMGEFLDDGSMLLKCTVRGKAREITKATIDFMALTLNNGVEKRYASSDFKDGDSMYLYFQAPVNGYLSVFLADESNGEVYCILPYRQSDDGSQKIKRDTPYVFFSEETVPASQRGNVDEYQMYCESGTVDRNDLYVVFSPKQFSKPNLNYADGIGKLDYDSFLKWLSKQKSHDKEMESQTLSLTIKKN